MQIRQKGNGAEMIGNFKQSFYIEYEVSWDEIGREKKKSGWW